jgi:Abortive infection C-terminus
MSDYSVSGKIREAKVAPIVLTRNYVSLLPRIRQGDVGGIGSFRTHGGSAHGRGRRTYEPLACHARLAIHASHTLVTSFLEIWDVRKKKAVAWITNHNRPSAELRPASLFAPTRIASNLSR